MEEFDETQLTKRTETNLATPAALPMSDIQLRIARDNPRDEQTVSTRINAELVAHPDYADEGFYSIPYKDKRKGVIHFVEGLSIRAAEHVWTRWGNCTVGARVADDRGTKIMVQGMFFDYETGLLNLSDLEVSKIGKARNGGSYPLDDKTLRTAVAAAEAKVKRNAFLGGIPVWIKDGYIKECQRLVLGSSKKPIAERIAGAQEFFQTRFGVAKDDVAQLIQKVRDSYQGIENHELLRYLLGLKNAIQEGNADLEFVFGEECKPMTMPQPRTGSGTMGTGGAASYPEVGDAQELVKEK